MTRSKRLLTVVLIALATRLAASVFWKDDISGVDVGRYLEEARNLALTGHFSFQGAPTAMNGPLFPAFLSLFWSNGSFHAFPAQLALCFLGVATVVLTWSLAEQTFGSKVALIAGVGMALAPMSTRYSVMFLTETLFTFLVTLACWSWLRSKWTMAGIAWGLSLLTRPTPLLFVLALPLLALIPARRKDLKSYLLMAGIAILLVAPWAARNAIVFKRFIPIAASGYGANVLMGTIDLDYRRSMWGQISSANLVTEGEIAGKDEVEVDRFYMKRALQRIEEHPLIWLKARIKQYPLLFVDLGQYLFTQPGAWKSLVVACFVTGNFFLLVFACYGMYTERRRCAALFPIALFPLYVAIVHLPMWVEGRYSLPIMPMVAAFSALGVHKLLANIRSRRATQLLLRREPKTT